MTFEIASPNKFVRGRLSRVRRIEHPTAFWWSERSLMVSVFLSGSYTLDEATVQLF
jgi:hypothetical protein